MMEKLDTVVSSIETLSENQKNMLEAFEKGRIMDRLDDIEEQTEANTDKIAELEVKVNAVMNGERSKNDWAEIVEEENKRRSNNVKIMEKMKEKEKKKEKLTYKEIMMKELKESAKVIVKEVREEEIDEEKGREEIIKNSKKILGFKPITRDNVEYFLREGKEKKEAEMEAIREFMNYFLRMDEVEIENIKIEFCKFNRKGDILYAQMNEYDVLDLLRRGGSAKSKEFSLVSFIPPQIFRRFTAAQDLCKKLRTEHPENHYTARIGEKDVRVLWREKEMKYWSNVGDDYIEELPPWEENKKWNGIKNEMELPNYEEYSPLKSGRGSESYRKIEEGISVRHVVKKIESSGKRKETSPLKEDEQPNTKVVKNKDNDEEL